MGDQLQYLLALCSGATRFEMLPAVCHKGSRLLADLELLETLDLITLVVRCTSVGLDSRAGSVSGKI